MMISVRRILISASILLWTASPALADQLQPNNSGGQEIECLAIGRVWSGSSKEITDIEKTPVPERYRQEAAQTGCEGWSFIRESLITWHYRYGSERSMSAALEYFEASAHRKTASTPKLAHALAQALADPATTSLASGAAPTEKLRRLQGLIEEWQAAVHWGNMKLVAAEFFNSQLLRDKAADDVSRAFAGFDVLAQAGIGVRLQQKDRLIDRLGIDENLYASVPDMQTRMAILKARLSADPLDISRASDFVDKGYLKAYSTALDLAERTNYYLCKPDPDADGKDSEFDEIKTSCDNDNDFEGHVRRFWIARAQVDLLMAADPSHFTLIEGGKDRAGSYYAPIGNRSATTGERHIRFNAFDRADTAIELARRKDTHDDTGLANRAFPFRINADDQIDLALRVAEVRLKLGEGLQSGKIAKDAKIPSDRDIIPADAEWRAREQWSEGMQELVPASLLALPTEYASRFRQIAGLYRTLFEKAAALGDDRPAYFDREAQAEEYFAQTLANLDRMLAADGGKP